MDVETLEEYFEYLDDLRESGVTNMFGSPQYLREDYGISRAEAAEVFSKWAKTFDGVTSPDERAAKAIA